MSRALAEPLVFFTIPFVLYGGFLLIQLLNPFERDHWSRRIIVPLALVGLLLALGSLLAVGITAPRYEGGYVPAHEENGRIVPGRMR